MHPIGDNVRRPVDHELPGPFDASGAASGGHVLKARDLLGDGADDARSGGRIVASDVAADLVQTPQGAAGEANRQAHFWAESTV